jgi:hypothetical protein
MFHMCVCIHSRLVENHPIWIIEDGPLIFEMDLSHAPASFQRCMIAIFSDLIEKIMEVFLDDFSVYGKTFKDCLPNLERVVKRCQMADLFLNWEKCHFMVQEGIVLGHKILEKGIEEDKAKIEVIQQLPRFVVFWDMHGFIEDSFRNFLRLLDPSCIF